MGRWGRWGRGEMGKVGEGGDGEDGEVGEIQIQNSKFKFNDMNPRGKPRQMFRPKGRGMNPKKSKIQNSDFCLLSSVS
jgi:hypothetical protein